ncbi:MAG: TolC family protein [Candidatus Omnitrophica bacterium]|nr:TolC family protein [Candidatus Omnitrophota bacterium]
MEIIRFKTFSVFILLVLCFSSHNVSAEEALTWGDCIKEAKKNHPDLISAEENINQKEADKVITRSDLYPQIDASADYSRIKTTTEKDSYSYGVSGSQLIFNGAKTSNDLKAASENIRAAQYSYRFVSSEIRYRLRSAFISLLKAQELLNITEEIARIRRDNLILITLRYEAGIEHKGALLTAEANLTQAKFEIIQSKRNLEARQRELLKEMGRFKFSDIRAEGSFEAIDPEPERPDFDALIKGNPSLEKLAAQKNSAFFGIKSKEADFYPKISASAGTSMSGADLPPDQDQWDIGIGLSLPIFEGGLRLAEIKKAKAAYNQAQADERSERDSIILALEQNWTGFLDAIDNVKVQKKFLVAAEERARIAEGQYSLGLIQFDSWTIIEDSLVKAKKTFIDAEANALQVEAGWIEAKGETLEYED